MSDLKPCPFCGGKATVVRFEQDESGNPIFAKCGCESCRVWLHSFPEGSDWPHGWQNKEQIDYWTDLAIIRWNRRANNGN